MSKRKRKNPARAKKRPTRGQPERPDCPVKIDARLTAAAPHLGYEWAMLRGARHADWKWAPAQFAPPEFLEVVKLANVHGGTENFLLHARLLYEFLVREYDPEGRNVYPDSVYATDLLEPGSGAATDAAPRWRSQRAETCKELAKALRLNTLHKRLAHLSYKRNTLPKGFNSERILTELEMAFCEWAECLTAPRRKRLKATMEKLFPGSCPY